jgi:hypothetical protein
MGIGAGHVEGKAFSRTGVEAAERAEQRELMVKQKAEKDAERERVSLTRWEDLDRQPV